MQWRRRQPRQLQHHPPDGADQLLISYTCRRAGQAAFHMTVRPIGAAHPALLLHMTLSGCCGGLPCGWGRGGVRRGCARGGQCPALPQWWQQAAAAGGCCSGSSSSGAAFVADFRAVGVIGPQLVGAAAVVAVMRGPRLLRLDTGA